MEKKEGVSRRSFFKTSAMTTAAVIGGNMLISCDKPGKGTYKKSFPKYYGKNFNPDDGVVGLLFSQVGYEKGFPVRIIVRLPRKDMLPGRCDCALLPAGTEKKYRSNCVYWGKIWNSHWWIAEFKGIHEEGEWDIEITSGDECLMEDSGVRVKEGILWDSTIEWSSVDMLERRVHFTKVGAGWQDAGTLWVESPAQSAMIIALAGLLELCPERFEPDFTARIHKQMTVGCDYLVMTQEKARELGFPKGAMSHDLLGHEKDVLPTDGWKAVIALANAARLLPGEFEKKKTEYRAAAGSAFQWLIQTAKPMGDYGYMRIQRGLPADAVIPKDEWPTRDLLGFCSAALEMHKMGYEGALNLAVSFSEQIMHRQIPETAAIEGYYGNFYEFDSLKHAETSWTQGIAPTKDGAEFGADIGGIYPNYLMPFIELLKLFPEHKNAEAWEQMLKNFTYGYLIPACEANPFYLVPQGIFENEGPVWFCGTFHGTNSIYGYTAAMAFELSGLLNEPGLIDIAYGNLQWIAGLNAGITYDNVKQGCVVFSTDIPQGVALPASMFCHIGKRWAGTWFQTRGSICNGFSTGAQFVFDTEPKKENDGPFSLTDEDWIPHSAGWLTGLMRLTV
jgi:hypothetical protein